MAEVRKSHRITVEDHSATCSCGWSFVGLDPLDHASTHSIREADREYLQSTLEPKRVEGQATRLDLSVLGFEDEADAAFDADTTAGLTGQS